MRVHLTGDPAYTMAYCQMALGEAVHVRQGAAMALSSGMAVTATTGGSMVKAFIRKHLAEESFWWGKFTAEVHDAWVAVAPPYPGDISPIEVAPDMPLVVTAGGLIAHTPGLEMAVRPGDLATIALHEGAVLLRLAGEGVALIASYGALVRVDLAPGQSVIIDTGHLVAWHKSVSLVVGPLGGLVTSFLTKEGLVGQMTGPGVVYMQSRAEQDLHEWMLPDREIWTGKGAARR